MNKGKAITSLNQLHKLLHKGEVELRLNERGESVVSVKTVQQPEMAKCA